MIPLYLHQYLFLELYMQIKTKSFLQNIENKCVMCVRITQRFAPASLCQTTADLECH